MYLQTLRSVSLILFLASTHSVTAQDFHWERTDRTSEGWIQGVSTLNSIVAAQDGTLLMMLEAGLHRIVEATDGSLNLEPVNPSVHGQLVGSHGDRIFMKWGIELWSSSDVGLSWSLHRQRVQHVGLIDGNLLPGTLVVTTYLDSLFIADLTGAVVSKVKMPYSFHRFNVSPSGYIFAWRSIQGGGFEYRRSTNLGASWTEVEPELPAGVSLYDIIYTGDSILYGRSSGGLVTSTDFGDTWELRPGTKGMNVHAVNSSLIYSARPANDPENPDFWILIRSTDLGRTWTVCDTLPGSPSVDPLADGSVAVGVNGTLLLKSDCLDQGREIGGDLRSARVLELMSAGSDFFALMYGVRHGRAFRPGHWLYRSDDDGEIWDILHGGVTDILGEDAGGRIYVLENRGSSYWNEEEGVRFGSDLHIIRSTDRGDTWGPIPGIEPGPRDGELAYEADRRGDGLLLAGRMSGTNVVTVSIEDVLYSGDGGDTFLRLDSTDWDLGDSVRLASLLLLPDGQVIGRDGSSYFDQTAAGRLDPRTGSLRKLDIPGDIMYMDVSASGTLYSWSVYNLYRSRDNGETWDTISLPESVTYLTKFEIVPPGDLLLEGSGRTFHSSDEGGSWEETVWKNVGEFTPLLEINRDDSRILTTDSLLLALAYYPYRYEHPVSGQITVYYHFGPTFSADSGRTWVPGVDDVIHGVDITFLAVNNRDQIIIASNYQSGLFRLSGISGVHEEEGRGKDPWSARDLLLSVDAGRISLEYLPGSSGSMSVELYDMAGRQIHALQETTITAGPYRTEIPTGNLTHGPILVVVRTPERMASGIVVQ